MPTQWLITCGGCVISGVLADSVTRSVLIVNSNPYESVDASAPTLHGIPTARRWLDGRTILVAFLSMFLGAVSWFSLSQIGGHSLLEATFFEMFFWFVGVGFLTGCIDPRNPWITWAMVYTGTYLLNLPLFPQDPLLIFGLIINIVYTGIGVLAGTLIPTLVAYTFPFRTASTRRWAGYAFDPRQEVPPEPTNAPQPRREP